MRMNLNRHARASRVRAPSVHGYPRLNSHSLTFNQLTSLIRDIHMGEKL